MAAATPPATAAAAAALPAAFVWRGGSGNPCIVKVLCSWRRLGRLSSGPRRRRDWGERSAGGPRGRARAQQAQVIQERQEEEEKELEAQILRLQNGSDVRGVALEGEAGRAVTLTPLAAFHLGAAFGEWVAKGSSNEANKLRVSLGRDPRVTGPALLAATAAGLHSVGCSVFDMGLATTPACFMSTVLPDLAFDASIMLTASHLPYTRNGLKFFTKSGGLNVADIEALCTAAAAAAVRQRTPPALIAPPLQVQTADLMPAYAEHLREVIKRGVNHPSHYHQPLQAFKVVVNAGNGSGGFFARDVLAELGADVSASLHLEPDGMFPNHPPNPEDKAAMAATVKAVLDSGSHLGVVFDTDVDRSGVVDEAGRVINGDRLIALLACLVLEEHPGATIVTDARTSDGLTDFIHRLGGTHCLYRVGYRNVINKGMQLNAAGVNAPLMMETSGHGAMAENYFLDDGAYSAVKIVVQMVRLRLQGQGNTLGSLIANLEEPAENVELRIDILCQPHLVRRRGAEVVEAFRQFLVLQGPQLGWSLGPCGDCWVSDGCLADLEADQDLTKEYGAPPGVDAHMYRAQVAGLGWLHLRQSIHNPNLALNIQASRPGGCRDIAHTLLHSFLLSSPPVARDLDLSNLQGFLQTS